MKQLMNDTIDGINKLSENHAEIKAEFRYSDNSPPLLTDTIIRLPQHEDHLFYSPIHSPTLSPISTSESPKNDD
ncbi:unnamed protein product [Absidia cylindrospora]